MAGKLVASSNVNLDDEDEDDARITLQNFWTQEMEDIERLDSNRPNAARAFRRQQLSRNRVRQIMKIDENLKDLTISDESTVILTKAAEIFIRDLSVRARIQSQRQNLRTMTPEHIAMAVADHETDIFDFLVDAVELDSVTTFQPRQITADPRYRIRKDLVSPVPHPPVPVSTPDGQGFPSFEVDESHKSEDGMTTDQIQTIACDPQPTDEEQGQTLLSHWFDNFTS